MTNPKPTQPGEDSNGQGWSREQQHLWYRGSQGSRLIPEKWLLALEEPDSDTLFMDWTYFERFGYLPADSNEPTTPTSRKRRCPLAPPGASRLPIGFARDCQSDKDLKVTRLQWYQGQKDKEPWIGLNCAACHTTEISVNGQPFRVDGAPTLADFQGFTEELTKTMDRTLNNGAKWDRFAARVVAPRRPNEASDARVAADRAMLKQAFTSLLRHQQTLAAFNQTEIRYGHGRLDAVGHILNTVAMLTEDPAPMRGEPFAPVSYPFIWNTHQHDFVQWNGLVKNENIKLGGGSLDIGAMGRNTSEVIGVFADVRLRRMAGLNGYRSSVDVENLHEMETLLSRLKSPAWPFAQPKPEDVIHGERLFRQTCAGCHAPLKRDDLTTPIKAEMTPIWDPAGLNTDPWMACNTFSYQAKGGLLTGTKSYRNGDTFKEGDPLPAVAATRDYLGQQAIGVLLRQKFKLALIALRELLGIERGIDVYEPESALEREPLSPTTAR